MTKYLRKWIFQNRLGLGKVIYNFGETVNVVKTLPSVVYRVVRYGYEKKQKVIQKHFYLSPWVLIIIFVDILHGSVGILNNYNLCHIKTIEWDEIITGPSAKYMYVYNFTEPERDCTPCHETCKVPIVLSLYF